MKSSLKRSALIIFVVVVATFCLIGIQQSVSAQENEKYTLIVNKVVASDDKKGVLIVNNDFDFRIKVLDTYFERNNSPLQGYGKSFLKACEKYNAPYDCTLLPGIAYIETRLCTLAASDRQKNCWGWGGAGDNRVVYKVYDTAIDDITQKVMKIPFYGEKFFKDARVAQFYYCGAHCDKWGTYVNQSREDINKLSVELGYPKLF
jgi:hypothetical protein